MIHKINKQHTLHKIHTVMKNPNNIMINMLKNQGIIYQLIIYLINENISLINA